MGTVTILWSAAVGVSATLAVVCWVFWLIDRQDPASLMFFVLAAALAASAFIELGMMHSTTTATYAEWLRWYHVSIFFAVLGQVVFVYYYLGTGRLWLVGTLIVARSIVLVVNFIVEPNFTFSSIASLRQVSFLGERVSILGAAVPRAGWQGFVLVSYALFMAYLLDASVRRWRMGGRESIRKALVIALGIVFPWLGTLVYTQLIVFGVIRAPVSSIPWFIGALLLMAYELGRDLIISKHKAIELVDLQSRFARVERANILGRLASALTHELSQPLSANAINAKTAMMLLRRERPDLEELRGILADVDSDSNRGIELVTRMRQLFKHGTIEMQPVRMEDVVQDAVALLGAEVTSKKVALSLLMEPDLPPVSGDRVHLSQVLLNLLANSIDAVQSRPPGARHIVVAARADDGKGEVEMSVRDSGPGIPDGIADKLFGPFFTTKPEGMGIGLTLSRTIIEAHGGRLWVDQPPEQVGAVFRFTLRQA